MAFGHVRLRATAVAAAAIVAAGLASAPPAHAAEMASVPMIFPVVGGASYSDTFGASRSGGRTHEGQDLMAPKMRKLVAVFTGTISYYKLGTTPADGNYIALRGDNGWSAVYIHMNNDTPGTDDGKGGARYFVLPNIKVGTRVYAGQQIGWTGDSGNAESTAPHTHFELVKGDAWSGTVYNPYDALRAARVLSAPYASGPHHNGSVLYASGKGTWLLRDGKRYLIPVSTFDAHGWVSAQRIVVTPGELASYPSGGVLPLPEGLVARDSENKLWVIVGGQRIYVPGGTDLAKLGTTAERVVPLPTSIVTRAPFAVDQTLPGVVRPGALLYDAAANRTWYIDGTVRRVVPNYGTMTSWGWTSADRFGVTTARLADVPLGEPMKLRDGTVFTDPGGYLYLVIDGTRRRIPNSTILAAFGYARVPRIKATAYSVGQLPAGSYLP